MKLYYTNIRQSVLKSTPNIFCIRYFKCTLAAGQVPLCTVLCNRHITHTSLTIAKINEQFSKLLFSGNDGKYLVRKILTVLLLVFQHSSCTLRIFIQAEQITGFIYQRPDKFNNANTDTHLHLASTQLFTTIYVLLHKNTHLY